MPGRWPKVAKGRWPRALKRPLQASTTLFLGRAPPAVAWGRRINQQTSPGGTTLQCFMKLHVAQSVATCPKLGGASNCMEFEWNWSSPVMETRAGGFNERCLISPVTPWIFPIFDFLVSVVYFHGTSSKADNILQHPDEMRWAGGFPNKGHPVINWNATAMSTGFHNWVKQLNQLSWRKFWKPRFWESCLKHLGTLEQNFPSSQGLPLVKGLPRVVSHIFALICSREPLKKHDRFPKWWIGQWGQFWIIFSKSRFSLC